MDIFEKVLNNYKIDESIKLEIREYISNESLNENFFDKLKERFPKAAEVSKLLSDKAESTLGNILNKVKDLVSFVNKIAIGIKELFIMFIESGKKFFMEQLKMGKLKEKLEELKQSKKEGLVKELKLIKEILTFYRKGFVEKVTNTIQTNLSSFFGSEQEAVVESLLLEKGNVLSTLVHKIEAVPPFSILHKIASGAEKGANVLIQGASEFTKKMGGPEFQLPVVALLVGLSIEYMVKSSSGHWLLDLVGPTPLGMAIKGVKITATLIALLSAIDGIFGTELIGSAHHGEEVKMKDKVDVNPDQEEVDDKEKPVVNVQAEGKEE